MRYTKVIAILAVLTGIAVFAAEASAMYHPGMGRFMQRDPGPDGMMGATRVGTMRPADGGRSFLVRDPVGTESAPDRTGVRGQYSDGMNLYELVRGNPVIYRDPHGTNIYLRTGGNTGNPVIDACHQQVCVDTWDKEGCEKTGVKCFSFGWTGNIRWFSLRRTWLGWRVSLLETTGGMWMMEGLIYEDDAVGKTKKTKKTTVKQDKKWLKYMLDTRVGTTDVYTAGWFNCRYYSQLEFADAP